MRTSEAIRKIIDPSLCSPEVYREYLERLTKNGMTRDENPESHFGVYFLPYNPKSQRVFIVNHRKAGLWLTPGGHVDKGETPEETLEREIGEELGIEYVVPNDLKPFLISITPINNPGYTCRRHYDIWYCVKTDGSNFNVDPAEFLDARWMTISEARELVTDSANLEALRRVEQI